MYCKWHTTSIGMNILQILPQLNYGGVETGVIDLARYVTRHNHKSVVVSSGGRLVDRLEAEGSKHYQLPVNERSVVSIARVAAQLIGIIRQERIDVVHARSWLPPVSAFIAAKKTGRAFVTTVHSHYRTFPKRVCAGLGDYIICPSMATAQFYESHFHLPNRTLTVVHRGIDMEAITFIDPAAKEQDTIRIGIIGRIVPVKGQVLFLQAMSRVIATIPHCKFLIVGDLVTADQVYLRAVRRAVSDLGLSDYVEFLGLQDDVSAILSQLHVAVSASVGPESFGRAVVEAQVAGVPVVATRIGAIPEIIIDNETGLLVDIESPDAMAAAVTTIVQNPDLGSYLARNAYQRVKEKFTLEMMATKTLEVYARALAGDK